MNIRKLTFGGIFVALGVVLPLAFHGIGLGTAFLPMHIPVILAGFVSGPLIAAVVGIITPLLSSALTGMPPLSPPIAISMAVELPLYGAIAGLAYQRWSLGKIPALLLSLLAGRLVYGFVGWLTLPLFGLGGIHPLYPIGAGLISSLPGVVVQLVLIPSAITLIERLSSSTGLKEQSRG